MIINRLYFFWIFWLTLPAAMAQNWPSNMSLVGYIDDHWQLYVIQPGSAMLQAIPTDSEPRTPTYNPAVGKIAYVGANGSLHEINLKQNSERILLQPEPKQAFTQPVYDDEGKNLFVVVLKDGTSIDTDIIILRGERQQLLVKQHSAQFEPYFQPPHTLYYSNVLCTVGCGKIIQETWRINLLTEDAEQLTLMNAIVRQPMLSMDGNYLYFSSNKAGNFHIWRLHLKDNIYQQLTKGRVSDSSPAMDSAGQLYFIRQSPKGTSLMQYDSAGILHTLALPEGIVDIRDLRINP